MGVRRMVYRLARNRKVWVLGLVFGIFYVDIMQMIAMAKQSEQESKLGQGDFHGRHPVNGDAKGGGEEGETSSGDVGNDYKVHEADYVKEYEDLLAIFGKTENHVLDRNYNEEVDDVEDENDENYNDIGNYEDDGNENNEDGVVDEDEKDDEKDIEVQSENEDDDDNDNDNDGDDDDDNDNDNNDDKDDGNNDDDDNDGNDDDNKVADDTDNNDDKKDIYEQIIHDAKERDDNEARRDNDDDVNKVDNKDNNINNQDNDLHIKPAQFRKIENDLIKSPKENPEHENNDMQKDMIKTRGILEKDELLENINKENKIENKKVERNNAKEAGAEEPKMEKNSDEREDQQKDENEDKKDINQIWIKKSQLNHEIGERGRREMTYNGYYKLWETINNTPVVKVVLLTYQRAGSSFAGELLTSGGEAMYVFEPLYLWRRLLGPGADPTLENNCALALGDLLDCRPEVISYWKRKGFTYFRRKLDGENFCEAAKLRLLKTIRSRAHFILPWIKQRPDIKIVHLVRDPRGILNSVQRGGRWWSDNNRDTVLQCGFLERDLELEKLGTDRYLRVRYEDLVDRPVEETMRVFNFMGVDFNEETMKYLMEHTSVGSEHIKRPGYFNTYRDSRFRHDHWKEKLDNRETEFIESVCAPVMAQLGYTPIPPA